MKPTEILQEEHQSIQEMLQVAEVVCNKLKEGEAVPAEHLCQIVDFIRSYADRRHHSKEEDHLFKKMEEAGFPAGQGPIGVMLQEHDLGRDLVKNMSEAAQAYSPGNREAGKKFVQNGRQYVELLTQHIYKEDNILYPMANRALSDEQQQELQKAFEEVEKKFVAEEADKQLEVLRQLSAIYLKKG